MYVPEPTWPVHRTTSAKCGFEWKNYRYFDPKTKGLDFTGMCEDIDKAPSESLFLMHVCAHNPTGVDPS